MFVGLNPQQPVASITIIESFLGLTLGMVIAAVVGRLIWPVLPQQLFRDDLLKFFVQLKALLNNGPRRERIRTQLAILQVEALQAAHQIRMTGFSGEERTRIIRLIRASQRLVMQSAALMRDVEILPDTIKSALRPRLEPLELEFNRMLDAFVECCRKVDARRPFPTLRDALIRFDEEMEKVRDGGVLAAEKFDVLLRTLELVNRYQAVAEGFEECSNAIQTLQLHRYVGDFAL